VNSDSARTIVVTGAASGIGAATCAYLRDQGDRVIGVDRAPADVTADLSTRQGRETAVRDIAQLAPDGINGFVPCAGLGGFTGSDGALLVSVNYFAAVELAVALRPLLAKAASRGEPAAVVLLSSNSVTCQPGWASDVAGGCLAGDEPVARELAAAKDAVHVYPATKAALAWWVRREGIKKEWIGAGIRINAVAPGMIATAMTDRLRKDARLGIFADAYPTAIGRPGRPEEIAAAIAFLLSEQASLMVGAVVFLDGGTDAIMHPLRPEGMNVPPIVMGAAAKVANAASRLKALRGK
jgi:NAD(P)-dependent dehydrogenase (short-subunit alcohol dehydrogenase family)